jgi:hypothetical protein
MLMEINSNNFVHLVRNLIIIEAIVAVNKIFRNRLLVIIKKDENSSKIKFKTIFFFN